MRLLENVYKDTRFNRFDQLSTTEGGGYVHIYLDEDMNMKWSFSAEFPDYMTELSIDEQVDYLYDKCCQDTSNLKDLREIALWMNKWYYPEDGFLLLCLKWPSRESDIKQLLRQALQHEQALNQQEK